MKKLILIFSLIVAVTQLKAQTKMPTTVAAAFKVDDAAALDKLVTKENVNDCYANYSLLAEAIHTDAPKCFDLLIAKGADVNKSCNGYVPPLMHALKYGHLDMVKTLVSNGGEQRL